MTRITISIVAVVIVAFTAVCGCSESKDANLKSIISISEFLHHEYNPSQGHVYVLRNYDVIGVRKNFDKIQVQASLFTNASMSSEEIIEKMVWIMKVTGTNQKILVEIHGMLKNEKMIEEETFSIHLTDGSGTKHHFAFARPHQLNVLTYERK